MPHYRYSNATLTLQQCHITVLQESSQWRSQRHVMEHTLDIRHSKVVPVCHLNVNPCVTVQVYGTRFGVCKCDGGATARENATLFCPPGGQVSCGYGVDRLKDVYAAQHASEAHCLFGRWTMLNGMLRHENQLKNDPFL